MEAQDVILILILGIALVGALNNSTKSSIRNALNVDDTKVVDTDTGSDNDTEQGEKGEGEETDNEDNETDEPVQTGYVCLGGLSLQPLSLTFAPQTTTGMGAVQTAPIMSGARITWEQVNGMQTPLTLDTLGQKIATATTSCLTASLEYTGQGFVSSILLRESTQPLIVR